MVYPNKLCLHEIDSKCHKCTNRYVGCHNECPDYDEFRKNLMLVKSKEKLEKEQSKLGSSGWYYLRNGRKF